MSSSAMTFDASVFTAMDAWFDACRVLVGGALFEYAFIIRLSQNPKANVARVCVPTRRNWRNVKNGNSMGKPIEERCKTYDRSAFMLFNSIFLVFCVVYGTICLSQ